MTEKSKLVGYVRKSNAVKDGQGGYLRMSIDVESFNECVQYASKEGRPFVTLLASADKIQGILEGSREVTILCQIILEADDVPDDASERKAESAKGEGVSQ